MTARLLLLHGFLSGNAAFNNLRAALGEDVETIAPDLPGYGSTPGPGRPEDYTLALLADAIEPLLDAWTPTHVLGHSMGAIVALELARRRPGTFQRVGAVGLPIYASRRDALAHQHRRGLAYRATLHSDRLSHVACSGLHRARRGWIPVFARGATRRHLHDTFFHSHAAHAGALDTVVFAGLVPALAAGVRTPVALLHGGRDRSAPVRRVETLAQAMGWPLTIVPGARHQVVIWQPRLTADWVRERLLAPGA